VRNRLACVVTALIALLAFAALGNAQTQTFKPPTKEDNANAKKNCEQIGQPGTEYLILCADMTPAGPAPKRDIFGSWSGPIGAVAVDKVPPFTDLGQKLMSLNHANFAVNVADSNDPINHCDPLGFPRNAVFELRGIQFGQMPNRVLILNQYERIWREVWTDGRALPKGFGSVAVDAPDPRYYGYSVGHWDGDYTFVVDSVGSDGASWLDNNGHPHSEEMHVTERFVRVDAKTLSSTVTVDDPKVYTKPFVLGRTIYKWIPDQQFEEQLCIPSQSQLYTDAIAKPAAQKK